MPARVTVSGLKKLAAELLELRPAVDRYDELATEIKAGLVKLKYKELDLGDQGRVFISTSEKVTITPALARDELGQKLADKIIQVKETVSNDILAAFVKAGEISQEKYERLLEKAEKTPATSLHVRPLK
jgi:hypothetical protein